MLASKPRGDTSLRLWFAFRHKCCRVAAVGLCLLGAAGTAGAQEDRSGFYVGLEVGVANASTVTSRRSGVTHPSRCDRLLYPSFLVPAAIAADPACLNNTPGSSVRVNEFETGGGFAGGLSVGYMAGTLRFEVEYLNRYHGSDRAAVSATSNAVQQNKNTEWSSEEPPYEEIRSYNAHQIFANAYYDFVNDSRWTPHTQAPESAGPAPTWTTGACSSASRRWSTCRSPSTPTGQTKQNRQPPARSPSLICRCARTSSASS